MNKKLSIEIENKQEDSISKLSNLEDMTKFLGQVNRSLYGVNPFDPDEQRDNEINA